MLCWNVTFFTPIGVFRAYFARKLNRLGMFFILLFNLFELQQLHIKNWKTFTVPIFLIFTNLWKRRLLKLTFFYAPVRAYGTDSSNFSWIQYNAKIWTKRYFYFLHKTVYRKKIGWHTIKLYANKQSKCYAETSLFYPLWAFYKPILLEN